MTYDASKFVPMGPYPTAEQVEEKIAAIRSQHPHLSYSQALLLHIFRATQHVSAQVSNTNGGGRYPEYCRQIRVPF